MIDFTIPIAILAKLLADNIELRDKYPEQLALPRPLRAGAVCKTGGGLRQFKYQKSNEKV